MHMANNFMFIDNQRMEFGSNKYNAFSFLTYGAHFYAEPTEKVIKNRAYMLSLSHTLFSKAVPCYSNL